MPLSNSRLEILKKKSLLFTGRGVHEAHQVLGGEQSKAQGSALFRVERGGFGHHRLTLCRWA